MLSNVIDSVISFFRNKVEEITYRHSSRDAESARPEPIFPSGQQYARDSANSQNMTTHISLINVWIGPST